ncbi:6341_t:CDS:2 [Funneliformis mosseae]|uniref:6341_t:CDS:1 n=1 Tax=Funneliformis mosseae TaxID=27381 RepID=A0A9N9E2E7_FUNMO|nr:6341_t:CDS:2 [Funneliformis mosseae]
MPFLVVVIHPYSTSKTILKVVKNSKESVKVIKTIFDEKHLSTKIDSEVIETWTGTFNDTEMDDGFLIYSSLSMPNYNTPVDNPVDVD